MEIQGFEPRMPEATDLQSAEVTNASRSPNSGTQGEIRTHDFTDLQSVAFDRSATCALLYRNTLSSLPDVPWDGLLPCEVCFYMASHSRFELL